MKTVIFSSLLLLTVLKSYGQYFVGIEDQGGKLIRRDSTGSYRQSATDSGYMIFFSAKYDLYKKMNKRGISVIVGNLGLIGNEQIGRHGKWTEYYETGALKAESYFCYGNPIGPVETFYPNGKPESKSNMIFIDDKNGGACRAGLYQEFYSNGQLKVEGFYKVVLESSTADSISVVDVFTGKETVQVDTSIKPRSREWGKWSYYDERGKLVRRADRRFEQRKGVPDLMTNKDNPTPYKPPR